MQQITLPNALDQKDWLNKVTPALDKPTKIGASLAVINAAFDKVSLKLFDFSGVKDAEEANKRMKEIEERVARPLQAIVGSLKKLESDVKGAQETLKKAGKDAAVKALLSSMASFASEAKSVPDAALEELKTLIKTFESKDKKEQEAAAKQAKEGDADPTAAADLKKKVLAHNAKVKKYIRDLRSGKFPSFPFAFAQNKVKEPYKKGKDWTAKSLTHVGPKAVKSFKSQFAALMGDDPFVFSNGEVRYSTTGKDAKKLIFLFETPLANPKQLKDALLFQCGYAPPLQLRKDTGEVIDEAGEGEDAGEDLGDVTDDDDEVSELTLTSAQKKTFQDAMALAGEPAKLIKRKVDEAQALAKSATGAARAKALIAEAETAAKALLAKAGESAKAQPGVSADLVERIRKASESWAKSSTQAEKGIDQVMLALNKMFSGDERQGPKVKDALRTLNNLKPKLKSDLGAKLERATREPNESLRVRLIKEAIAAAEAVEKRIADDPLMGELDGANNDVLPGVNIIGPMKSAIGTIRALV